MSAPVESRAGTSNDATVKRRSKQGLHGEIYQVKVLMLFLKRAWDGKKYFRLYTEKEEAGKFDDICFEVTNGEVKEYRLLQVKHKDDESEKIQFDSLLTESDGPYSLVKYFFSYQDSKDENIFKGGKIKDVTVFTNADFNSYSECDSYAIKDVVNEIEDTDDVLDISSDVSGKESVRYRFDKSALLKLLKPKLENYNLTRLAKRLAKCFLAKSEIRHHQGIFKDFHGVLAKEVIDVKNKKFLNNFLDNTSEKTKKFRELFADEIKRQSKQELSLEDIISMDTFKDQPFGLNISDHFGKKGKKVWPTDTISDKDIKDFLGCLVFAVNQPGERRLGEIIKDEMGKDCVYESVFQKMLDWLNRNEGNPLEDGKIIEEAKRKLSELGLTGLTLDHETKIESLGIEFNRDAIQRSGLSDIATSNGQIFYIVTEHTVLTAVKVLQEIRDSCGGRYLFMRLDSVLRLRDTVIGAFQGDIDILVVECESDEGDVQELSDQLLDVVESKIDKKVILITGRSNALAEKLEIDLSICDENNSITDLTEESQERLLTERLVTFQGTNVFIGDLVDEEMKHLIQGEVLSKLINKESIEIDKAPVDVDVYYINRKINRRVTIKDGCLEEKDIRDLFVVSGIGASELSVLADGQTAREYPQTDPDIRNPIRFIASDSGKGAEEHLDPLHRDNPNRDVHWLERVEGRLVWRRSHGALSNLRKYVDTKSTVIKHEVSDVTDVAGRVVIVSAEAGMGKSTLLTKLQMGAQELRWIARINLIEHSTQLKLMGSLDEKAAVGFLYEALGFLDETTSEEILGRLTIEDNKISLEGAGGVIQTSKSLDIAIFNRMYNEGNVTLLFDGFDEISPDYTHKVIELLKFFKDTKVGCMWITTRPYDVHDELENHLSEFSYSVEPIVEDDQKRFLSLFWKTNLKLEELVERRSALFIDHLLHKFSACSNDRERKFLGVPLQLQMLAEIFLDTFKQFHESTELDLSDEHKQELDKILNLVVLYETFIKKKFYTIQFEQKEGMKVDRLNTKKLLDGKYETFEKEHRILALYGLFKEDCLNGLLSEGERNKVNELVQSIRQGVEKTGIINKIIDDRPDFVHRTFAEYFAADWLVLNRKEEKVKSFLRDKLFEDENRALRSFFDRMLIRGDAVKYETHAAVLNGDERMFRENFSDPLKAKIIDAGGRKPLHLAAAYGYSIMTETLLRYDEDVGTQDDIFGWTPLGYADKGRHWDVAEKLLQKGARGVDMLVAIERATNVGDKNNTLLHTAARMGYTEFAKLLIETGNANVNAGDDEDVTPLHEAARSGDVHMVKLLIGNYADFTSKASGHRYSGYMPIHFAARDGRRDSVEIIQFLVDIKNAEFDTYDHYGRTPLLLAAENGHLDIVKYLIEKGAEVVNKVSGKFCDFESGSILHLIASNCRRRFKFQAQELSEVVQIVIKKGVNINLADNRNGNTPLHLVTEGKANFYILAQILKFAETFIRNGADVNVKNKQGQTPRDLLKYIIGNNADKFLPDYAGFLSLVNLSQSDIAQAALNAKIIKTFKDVYSEQQMIEKLRDLVIEGANVDAKNESGRTLLHEASCSGKLEVVKYLISQGANVNARDSYDSTPLHRVAYTDYLSVVEYLFGKNALVCAKDRDGRSALHIAAMMGKLDTVKYFLDRNVDVNAVDKSGLTPLHLAFFGGADVVEYLINRGANPNAEDRHGSTPLSIAATQGSLELVQFLLRHGADPNKKDNKGRTPLDLAQEQAARYPENEKYQIIKSYLLSNTDKSIVKYSSSDTWNRLDFAAEIGDWNIATSYLKQGGNITDFEYVHNLNSVDERGVTLLAFVISVIPDDDNKIVSSLVNKGANVNPKSVRSETPLHMAVRGGKFNTVKFLMGRGADIGAVNKHNETPLDLTKDLQIKEILELTRELFFIIDDDHTNKPDRLAGNINVGAIFNANFSPRGTPLHEAVKHGHVDVVKFLVGKQAELNARDGDHNTPLHKAVEKDHLHLVQFLIKRSAEPDLLNDDNETPLHVAIKKGNVDIAKYLVESGAGPNVTSGFSPSPFDVALEIGNLDVIKSFVIADVKYKVCKSLREAASRNRWDVVKYLLENDNRFEHDNEGLVTILHQAIDNNRADVVEVLVGRGVGKNDPTRLRRAVTRNSWNVIKFLLKSDDHYNPQKNLTVLLQALYNNRVDIIEVLVKGHKIDLSDAEVSWALLDAAIHCGQVDTVNILIENGADVLARNDFNTALNNHHNILHEASYSDNEAIIKLILEQIKERSGQDPEQISRQINVPDSDGDTPLIWAVKFGKVNSARVLLEYGAGLDVRNNVEEAALY